MFSNNMLKLLSTICILTVLSSTFAFPGIKNGRIIGGKEAIAHSRPYEVYLIFTTLRESWICGGALLSNYYILTAGHCVSGALDAKAILGAHDVTQEESTQAIYKSKKLILHEGYLEDDLSNDIGLIRLSEPVTLTSAIQTIALPSKEDVDLTYENETVTISGWGVTDGHAQQYSRVLNEVNVTVIANSSCKEYFEEFKSYQICTSGADDTGACYGDSGSPLIYNDKAIGLVSYSEEYCPSGYPTVFTNVASFLDWIEENLDEAVG